MSLPFADGADLPLETRIADAVIARVRLLHRDNGLFLAYVGEAPTMPSRLGDEAWDMLVQRLRSRAPAALVIIDSSNTDANGTGGSRWQVTYKLTIALLSTHRRDTIDGRINPDVASAAADNRDPGLRATCELVDMLVRGWRPDVDGAREIKSGSRGMQTVFVGKAGTMRELDYDVTVDIESSAWPDPVRYLDSIRTELGAQLSMETEVSQ